jgi:AraC-like DNA-binding protein
VLVPVRSAALRAVPRLRDEYPRIPFIALAPFTPGDGPLLAECRGMGFDAVLVQGMDDPALGELVGRWGATAKRRATLADAPRLLRLTEPIQLQVWEEALARAGTPTTTGDIARTLKRTREHVSREFGAGGAPNLKRVIDLCRVVWAADLLGNPGYSVAGAARVLRFASPSHLAVSARRVTGLAATELSQLGPRRVLERFLRGHTRSRL